MARGNSFVQSPIKMRFGITAQLSPEVVSSCVYSNLLS